MTNPLSVFGSMPLAIEYDQYDRPYGSAKPYAMSDGIAVIDICGALSKDPSIFEQLIFGATSYAQIEDQIELAVEDADVKAIMLRINSPGGSVSGMFQASRTIAAARKMKPVWAVADELAASAAYMVGSAAAKIWVPAETGAVGSIGVIAQRVDVSEADKKMGVKFNLISAGQKKEFGNPHAPMTEAEAADIQAEVDRIYGLFVDGVSRNRKMAPEAVRATEAGLFTGKAAVEAGLADSVGTFAEAMAAMGGSMAKKKTFSMAASAGMTSIKGGSSMEETNETQAADTSVAAVDVAAVRAEAEKAGYDAAADIIEICAIAGKPDLAAAFIADRKPMADIRKALLTARATAQEGTQIQSHVLPNTGTQVTTSIEDNPIVQACAALAAKGAK